MALTVIGFFDNANEAHQAVEHLVNAGFSRNQIDLSAQSGTSQTGTQPVASDQGEPSGTSAFFDSLFDNDGNNARQYAHVAERSSVVTVHAQTNEEAKRAADMLDSNGAVNVGERATQYGYAQSNTTTTTPTGSDQQSINVIEENLQVGKQTVETGGVRLRSRIVERPVEEHLRLRQERVVVQRTPVDRPVSAADFDTFKEGEITLTEHAERAVVAKEARVVEEVTVGKTVEEHDEVIRDTVRRTDVDIEPIKSAQTNTPRTEEGGDEVTYATT